MGPFKFFVASDLNNKHATSLTVDIHCLLLGRRSAVVRGERISKPVSKVSSLTYNYNKYRLSHSCLVHLFETLQSVVIFITIYYRKTDSVTTVCKCERDSLWWSLRELSSKSEAKLGFKGVSLYLTVLVHSLFKAFFQLQQKTNKQQKEQQPPKKQNKNSKLPD